MFLDGNYLQEYSVSAEVPSCFILSPALFLQYINDLPNNVICNIAIYVDDSTIYYKASKWYYHQQQLELASELESDLRDTGLEQKVACWFQCWKNLTRFVLPVQ